MQCTKLFTSVYLLPTLFLSFNQWNTNESTCHGCCWLILLPITISSVGTAKPRKSVYSAALPTSPRINIAILFDVTPRFVVMPWRLWRELYHRKSGVRCDPWCQAHWRGNKYNCDENCITQAGVQRSMILGVMEIILTVMTTASSEKRVLKKT